MSSDKRDYELGRDFIKGFYDTMLGKALFAAAKLLGPMRSTRRMPRTVRSVNNYSTAGHEEIAINEVEVWILPALRPHYYVGVFTESGRLTCGPGYTVTLKSFENEKVVFGIRW